MFSESNAVHPVGCDSPLQIVMAVGCDVTQMVVRRLAGRQFDSRLGAPARFFSTELTSDEEMEKNIGEWRPMNVLYEFDGFNEIENIKINQRVVSCHQTFQKIMAVWRLGDGEKNSKRKVLYMEALKGKSLSSRQKTTLESGYEVREV
jgi:hypothetical protein